MCILELFPMLPGSSILILVSDISHRTHSLRRLVYIPISLPCVFMEIGIFDPNWLVLQRNKALVLDVSVVTLELHGFFFLS